MQAAVPTRAQRGGLDVVRSVADALRTHRMVLLPTSPSTVLEGTWSGEWMVWGWWRERGMG
jgi:hypothetical protein